MSAIIPPRLAAILSLTSLIGVSSTILASPAIRATLRTLFNPRSHPIHFLALFFALLLNVKSFPLIWHFRVFKGMYYQLYAQPGKLPRDALFRPLVNTSLYTPLPECDYNGHKSNSTYFSDCDASRAQLVTCLLRKGIRNVGGPHAPNGRRLEAARKLAAAADAKAVEAGVSLNNSSAANAAGGPELVKGRFMIALGAVSCHFKREIKPYQRFEIWTRILTWDRKWIYIVSHLVKDGVVMPEGYALQPGRTVKRKRRGNTVTSPSEAEQRAEWKNAILATSLAKYVIKKGRLTIAPEIVLQNSDLLPPKPDDPEAETVAAELPHWTWERVEQERLRGLEIAKHFDALDKEGGLHDEFPVGRERDGETALRVDTLGTFTDLML